MKGYEILALSRSGHHSVVNWIIRNTIGFQCNWNYKMNQIGNTGLFYLNETNHDIPDSFKFIEAYKDQIKKLYLNYEDTPGEYTVFNDDNIYRGPMSLNYPDMDFVGRVVVIRNFYNLLASRIKLNENKLLKKWDDNEHLLEVGEQFIYRWKSQVKSCLYNNTPYLKFEDWLTNKEIREKFLLDNFGLVDHFGIEGVEGTRSSFGDRTNVMNRHQGLNIPEETKKLIREDGELHYLMGSIGYEFKSL